jgi:hypothetical protein
MKRSSRPRTIAALAKSLHQQLDAYALAAGAAGVGLLALSQPAEAKIVFTPAHVRIAPHNAPFPLDLNHDGIVDFYLLHVYSEQGNGHHLDVCQFIVNTSGPFCNTTNTNAIRAIASMGRDFGAMLRSGARIRRADRFISSRVPMGGLAGFINTFTRWYGPWMNGGEGVKNRYLGLKFKINGRFHYGWARLTIKTTQNNFTAILTGYAYETVPGKSIIAGKTKGPDVITLPATTTDTLGHLALGRK